MRKARAGVALVVALFLALAVAAVPAAARSRAAVTVTRLSASSGPIRGGNRISVWGSGFRHVRSVIFGGTRGRSVHVLSSHHLTVIVPAHRALTVHVKVYTATARSYRRAADRYTYVGKPEITSITPAGDAVKGGRRVRITGYNFHAPATVLFGSLRGKAVWVANSHLLTVTVPAHATGAVHVRVVTRYGVSRATGADEFSYHPPPVVSGASPVLPSTDTAIHLTGSGFDPQTEVFSGATEVATRVESASSLWASLIAVTPGAHTLTVRTPWGATTARYSVYQAAARTLTVASRAGGHAELAWTLPIEPYPVWSSVRRADGATPPATITDGTAIGRVPGSTLTDDSVVPGHTYSYAVFEDDGHGHISGAVTTTVTVPRDPVTVLGVPELVDPPTGSPVAISCTATQCVEVDAAGAARTYDGASWSDPVPTGAHPARPYNLSCADSSFCTSLDADGAGVAWDGHDWTRLPELTVKSYVSGVSCPVAGWCVATGDQGEAAILSEGSWHELQLGPHPWNDVSCATVSSCLAVGMDGSAAHYDGSTWSVQAMPLTGMHWTAVSCATPSWCTALGYKGGTTSYAAVWSDGQWSAPTLVDGAHRGLTLDCPAVGACVAASLNAYVVTLSNGTWSQPQRVGAGSSLAVGCLSAVACVGVDPHGDAATFDGTTWSTPTLFDPAGGIITSLSCVGADACALVDLAGNAAVRTGAGWSEPTHIEGADWLFSVSCASAALCLAAGVFRENSSTATYAGMAWFDGRHWSAPFPAGPGIDYLTSVSCPTEQFCMAVGGADPGGIAQTWDGQSWSDPVQFDPDATPLNVTCASDTFCMAAGGDAAWRWTSGSWTRDRPSPDASFSDVGIACFSETSCLIASHSGDLARWDGTQWTAGSGRTTGNVLGLACTSATYCLAVQRYGATPEFTDFDGTSWSAPEPVSSVIGNGSPDRVMVACGTTCYIATPDGRVVSTSH